MTSVADRGHILLVVILPYFSLCDLKDEDINSVVNPLPNVSQC